MSMSYKTPLKTQSVKIKNTNQASCNSDASTKFQSTSLKTKSLSSYKQNYSSYLSNKNNDLIEIEKVETLTDDHTEKFLQRSNNSDYNSNHENLILQYNDVKKSNEILDETEEQQVFLNNKTNKVMLQNDNKKIKPETPGDDTTIHFSNPNQAKLRSRMYYSNSNQVKSTDRSKQDSLLCSAKSNSKVLNQSAFCIQDKFRRNFSTNFKNHIKKSIKKTIANKLNQSKSLLSKLKPNNSTTNKSSIFSQKSNKQSRVYESSRFNTNQTYHEGTFENIRNYNIVNNQNFDNRENKSFPKSKSEKQIEKANQMASNQNSKLESIPEINSSTDPETLKHFKTQSEWSGLNKLLDESERLHSQRSQTRATKQYNQFDSSERRDMTSSIQKLNRQIQDEERMNRVDYAAIEKVKNNFKKNEYKNHLDFQKLGN